MSSEFQQPLKQYQVMVYGRDHPGIRTSDPKKGWSLEGDVEGN